MKKLLILFGIISLILGIIGVFVPLLPATPFILLAAWLFARSSDKLYNWLMHHKVFGKIVRDYHIDKSISLHAKIISLSFMWTTMLYTIAVPACGKIWLQFILAVIAIGVTIYILHFKTKQK
ncbi:MAG: YbaN family protein [Paludibacter sp.]|nr:YbaN family protein [Paludibacter sp.]